MFEKMLLGFVIVLGVLVGSNDFGMVLFAIAIYCIIALFAKANEGRN